MTRPLMIRLPEGGPVKLWDALLELSAAVSLRVLNQVLYPTVVGGVGAVGRAVRAAVYLEFHKSSV
jgi:hypothetical protein